MKTAKSRKMDWNRVILLVSAFVMGAFIGLGLFYPKARTIFLIGVSFSGGLPLGMILREIVDLTSNPGEETQKFSETLPARLRRVLLYQILGVTLGLLAFTIFRSAFLKIP